MSFLDTARHIVSTVPPLVCDDCEWPTSADHLVREPDGSFLGRIVCTLCLEDALAARKLEQQP